jgi:ABC-2 type transport system ATP-binding protein
MLQIDHLYKSYGKKEVLRNISLELVSGKIYGLVGENGSGKTTLFECIRNLHDYKGLIIVGEQEKIGLLPTSIYFYYAMKGIEYIEFCLSARKQKINRSEIEEVNELFELPLNEYAANYSTGMKKKLALMALLMQKNDIFILDEPFNGLDLTSCIIIKYLLLKMKEKEKTIFLSSHIIHSLTDICDSIFHLHNGVVRKTYLKQDFESIEHDIINESVYQKLEAISGLFYSRHTP